MTPGHTFQAFFVVPLALVGTHQHNQYMDTNTKYCGSCHQDLPRDEFDTDLRRRDGKYPSCRSCRQAWSAKVDAMIKRSRVA